MLALLGALGLSAAGCATGPRGLPEGVAAERCVDARFGGVYTPSTPGEQPFRLKISVRVCPRDELLLHARGVVGSPVLVVAIRGERLLMLLPRERRAVEGSAEDRRLWLEETGLPFDGTMLRVLLTGEGETSLGPQWEARLERGPDELLPSRLLARHAGGATLELVKRDEQPSSGPVLWPEVPGSFEVQSYAEPIPAT
jgi:hypothetical protein